MKWRNPTNSCQDFRQVALQAQTQANSRWTIWWNSNNDPCFLQGDDSHRWSLSQNQCLL